MTIFFEADALAALPLPARRARVWQILAALQAADEFAVALDFAVLQGWVDADFAPHLRGDPSAPAPTRYWISPVDGLEMVWIPAGPFLLGGEQRRVESQGFFLARHPVTNSQFDTCVTANTLGERDSAAGDLVRDHASFQYPPAAAQHPVTGVSYLDALAYCAWAGLTLPSEWLWEKAARGLDGRTYPWGEHLPYALEGYGRAQRTAKRLAQIRETGTCAVEQFAAVRSPFGCEQLVGNVSEWCVIDEELVQSTGKVTVPQLVPDGNTRSGLAAVRGSSFKRRSLSRMASSHRRRLSVTRRNTWVGFRPAFYPPANRIVRASSA